MRRKAMEDEMNATRQLVNIVLREAIAKLEDLKKMGVSEEVEAEIDRTIERYRSDIIEQ